VKSSFRTWLRDLYYEYRDEGGVLSFADYWAANREWLRRTFKESHTVRVEEDDGEPS
jgi:hypothetical protein